MIPQLSVSRRIRTTPFTSRVEAAGVKAYTVYNHMLLPTIFDSLEADYWHLCEHVQVWDVSCERQAAIQGKDACRLVQLMTPRNLSKSKIGRCLYLPLCDVDGSMINDPIAIKLTDNHWWLSIADSDVLLWAKGLATGMQLDVQVSEPDVWPLAVQGPKADTLMERVFGAQVKDIGFFHIRPLVFQGVEMQVARSGWSKQGGFEIYVNQSAIAGPLWDELFKQGQDLQVRAGCPNLIERIESSLLSFGNDMSYDTTPLEVGLDAYVDLQDDIESLSLPALRQHTPEKKIKGLIMDANVKVINNDLHIGGQYVGEIRSMAYSPRYNKQLAFILCHLHALGNNHHVSVITDTGCSMAQLCDLPFDFKSLNLLA